MTTVETERKREQVQTEESTVEPAGSRSGKVAGEGSRLEIFWLCSAVLCLWIVCTVIIYFLFSDWPTRGTVGDSFGAVNALFSGLAFAGVIYSLNLQRKELTYQREEMLATRTVSEAQLIEMQHSRELLAQPLPIPEIAAFDVERARLFYSPPHGEHSAQSRYFVNVNISNPTQYPAIGVNVSCFIQFGDNILGSADSYVSMVAPNANIDDPLTRPDFLFAGDTGGLFFDSLRQHDPRKVPTLFVSVLFKNVAGAHFRLVQAFRIYASDTHVATLRLWHTGIAGFQAKFKQELTHLNELKRKGREDEWDDLFASVKNEFEESAPSDEKVRLRVNAVPASFSLSHIQKDEFEEEMREARYPQLINTLYGCPSELDSRK